MTEDQHHWPVERDRELFSILERELERQNTTVQLIASENFTSPAVLKQGATTWLFAADGGGTAAWTYSAGRLTAAWSNTNGGTSPVTAGGLLFVYDPGGSLRMYDPATGRAIATLPVGGGHWNSPIVADGRIALPEGSANNHATSGILNIWRLP